MFTSMHVTVDAVYFCDGPECVYVKYKKAVHQELVNCLINTSLLSNATVGALIRNVGPSESMIRLSFNMAAASHIWFRNEEF